MGGGGLNFAENNSQAAHKPRRKAIPECPGMDCPLLLNVSATKQETEKSGCEDFTSCQLVCKEWGPPCDPRASIHRQEAEAPDSVKGRTLNVQVQEE